MRNTYAINVDPDVSTAVRASLKEILQSDDKINGWWNHLPGLYLVTSEFDAKTIARIVEDAVKPWSFLVIKVDPEDSQGWLPDRAWGWIKKRYA